MATHSDTSEHGLETVIMRRMTGTGVSRASRSSANPSFPLLSDSR